MLDPGHRGGGHRGFRDLDAAAAFLGIGEVALRERLREGETLAEVAKAEGKSVGVVSAMSPRRRSGSTRPSEPDG